MDRAPGRHRASSTTPSTRVSPASSPARDSAAALADRAGRVTGALVALLTVVETGGEQPRAALAALLPAAPAAAVVGITGAPGAGKSTLTDRLVARLRAAGERVAVLAIDPTSPFTGGAILGDRVRMQAHDTDADVFIRSMATRGQLGGLSPRRAPGDPRARRRRVRRGCSSRPSASARWRSRSPAPPTPRSWSSPRLGRRGPGQQGRPARDRRRVRGQQGRPRRVDAAVRDLQGMLDARRAPRVVARRSSPRSQPTAAASTSSSTRSPRIEVIWCRPGSSQSGANSAFGTSCARDCARVGRQAGRCHLQRSALR